MKHERYTAIEGEEWKPILGYEKYYMVSNIGRVRVVSRSGKFQDRILKPFTHRGYLHVLLTVDKVSKRKRLHRLIAIAFIPNPENKPEINHKDFNKTNNRLDNIEWCTGKENYLHAIKGGRNMPPRQKQYKIPIQYRPPAGEEAWDAKTFYQYDLSGKYIQELKGVSEHSKKASGDKKGLFKAISKNHAFYGFRYSYTKAPHISIPKYARNKNVSHCVTGD